MPKIEVDGESVGWKDETRFEQEAVVTPTRKRGRNNSEEILVKVPMKRKFFSLHFVLSIVENTKKALND